MGGIHILRLLLSDILPLPPFPAPTELIIRVGLSVGFSAFLPVIFQSDIFFYCNYLQEKNIQFVLEYMAVFQALNSLQFLQCLFCRNTQVIFIEKPQWKIIRQHGYLIQILSL